MTRRERLEAKLEKRHDWAASAARKSTSAFNHAHALVAGIPMGQPVLIGHHSEKAHRRVLDRSWNAMGKACALTDLSKHHEGKAAGLAIALDKTIFSDDSDAVEAIEQRIAANEAKREQMKKVNALYRKGNAEGLAALGFNLDNLRARLKDQMSWLQMPYAAYELTNLGARIRTDKERLVHIKRQQTEQAAVEATENGIKIDRHDNGYASVRFAEKPDYSIIRALKDAGFRWGAGHWFGQSEKLPACVSELIAA